MLRGVAVDQGLDVISKAIDDFDLTLNEAKALKDRLKSQEVEDG